jgi:hypothetical protein
MDRSDTSRVRKRLLSDRSSMGADNSREIDIASHAQLAYSSEDPEQPLENLVDGQHGRGASRWASGRPDATEFIVLEFDQPQSISRLIYEVEESRESRTQEVVAEVSSDRGATYRQVFAQDYTFDPRGATFQHEDLRVDLAAVTHLRLTIVPNKGGRGVATLTSLRLFA